MHNVELSNGAHGRMIIVGDILGGFQDDVRIRGTKGDLMFYGNKVLMRPTGGDIQEVPCALPKGYPISPCDNFVKLIRGRCRQNRVPFLFGVRVALLTEAMLRSAHQGAEGQLQGILQGRPACPCRTSPEAWDEDGLQRETAYASDLDPRPARTID